MKRTNRWNLLVLILALTAAMTIAACGDDDDSGSDTAGNGEYTLLKDGVLTVGSDIPYIPFEQGDAPDYEGFDIDLINEVADRLELETAIVDVPFDALLSGRGGRFDLGIAATTITPARENRIDFSDPYFNSGQSLLVRADSDIKSIDDITADTIVGAQDGTTGETYANDNTDADVRGFAEIDDAYGALAREQVDAVLNDQPSTLAAVEDNPDLAVVDNFDTGEEYGVLFTEDADALREAVNDALQKIKDDGTLNELYQKWFSDDAPESLLKATHEPK